MGASAGGVYPLLGPGLSSENQVGVDGGNKTTVDNTDYLTETASAPVEEIVAQLNKTDLDETVPQKLFEIGGDEEKVLEEEGIIIQTQTFKVNELCADISINLR